MSAPVQTPPLSFEELLEQEEHSEVRHEYIGGRLYAMAGGTPEHADIVVNITSAVQSRLRGKPCRGSSNDQRVRTSESSTNWYYPDFLIKCPPHRFHPQDANSLVNPRAIFEVLSPNTELFDRTGKFDEYRLISELTDYILVSTQLARVDHFQRLQNDQWGLRSYTALDQELTLENFEISVPLAELYEDVAFGYQAVSPELQED